VVGSWASIPDHLMVIVYDAPNMEALMKFAMEPEVMGWSDATETRLVMTAEESMKLLK
jgi:hypothetical protein